MALKRICALGLFFLGISMIAGPAFSGEPYRDVQTLLETSKTVTGQQLSYPSGEAKVTALLITLAPGESTGIHKHDVPIVAYILEGEAVIDYGGGNEQHFKAGDAFLEAVDQWHDGRIVGDKPAKILAVFLGTVDAKKVIKKKP